QNFRHYGLASTTSIEDRRMSQEDNLCAVPAKNRVDCGYPQISPEQCVNRGCCFDSSIPEVPWCFKPLRCLCTWVVRSPAPRSHLESWA
uniref:Trefoil factor 3 n=1 Tax=Panthera leo TaxID=9689 RepID=A0A8C8XNH4_PANLE